MRDAVQRQQDLGLQAVTDGEFRRDWWHLDFLSQLDGVTLKHNEGEKFKIAGQSEQPPIPTVTGRIGCSRPIMVEDFKFLKSVTARHGQDDDPLAVDAASARRPRGDRPGRVPRISMRSGPTWPPPTAKPSAIWPTPAAAICSSTTSPSPTCATPRSRHNCRANGDDPAALPRRYAEVINAALADKPADMAVTIHTCRGNFKSAWVAEGGYAPVVEAMFSTDVDGYFMEFDSARAGGFEPLRALPRGKKVVLGLVTTKVGALESKDDLKRRIDEAAKYVPIENLCLSPQCGFSSTHHGNALSIDDQWRKLERVVEVASEVWGNA